MDPFKKTKNKRTTRSPGQEMCFFFFLNNGKPLPPHSISLAIRLLFFFFEIENHFLFFKKKEDHIFFDDFRKMISFRWWFLRPKMESFFFLSNDSTQTHTIKGHEKKKNEISKSSFEWTLALTFFHRRDDFSFFFQRNGPAIKIRRLSRTVSAHLGNEKTNDYVTKKEHKKKEYNQSQSRHTHTHTQTTTTKKQLGKTR